MAAGDTVDVTLTVTAAVLRWSTALEVLVEGFHVLRADYDYRDDTVQPGLAYYYKVREVELSGATHDYGPYEVSTLLKNSLEQNHPNPFNPTTTIRFSIAEDSHVRLAVYDVTGRLVRTLVNEARRANTYELEWDGRNDASQPVATGMYFYRITAGKFTQTRKMLLLK
jgi:hypothetical protein